MHCGVGAGGTWGGDRTIPPGRLPCGQTLQDVPRPPQLHGGPDGMVGDPTNTGNVFSLME